MILLNHQTQQIVEYGFGVIIGLLAVCAVCLMNISYKMKNSPNHTHLYVHNGQYQDTSYPLAPKQESAYTP